MDIDVTFDLVPALDLWYTVTVKAVPTHASVRSYDLVVAALHEFMDGGTPAEVLA